MATRKPADAGRALHRAESPRRRQALLGGDRPCCWRGFRTAGLVLLATRTLWARRADAPDSGRGGKADARRTEATAGLGPLGENADGCPTQAGGPVQPDRRHHPSNGGLGATETAARGNRTPSLHDRLWDACRRLPRPRLDCPPAGRRARRVERPRVARRRNRIAAQIAGSGWPARKVYETGVSPRR